MPLPPLKTGLPVYMSRDKCSHGLFVCGSSGPAGLPELSLSGQMGGGGPRGTLGGFSGDRHLRMTGFEPA